MINDITTSEEVMDKRYRNFMLLLYPEWDNYQDILFDIKGSFKNYAYIKHTKESEEKKDHVHLLLSIDNARTISSISKRLDIPINLIQPVKSLRASCRYLIHKDSEDKFQYDLSDVIVSDSFKNKYYGAFDDLLSDDEIMANIYNFCKELKYDNPTDYLENLIQLTLYVEKNGWFRVYKKIENVCQKILNF